MSNTGSAERMNKPGVLHALADRTGFAPKVCGEIIEAFAEIIVQQARAGGSVYYPRLGTFEGRMRKATTVFPGVPERTQELPRRRYVSFKAATAMKEAVEK